MDAAAAKSQTIRYQRECARQWVKDNKGRLIEERVFMELAPDRGREHIVSEVEQALKRCRETGAQLLVVDMAARYGWRGHAFLNRVLHDNDAVCQRIYPDALLMDGQSFDPVAHFRKWRAAQKEFIGSKDARIARARAAAEALNEEGHVTATGKPWTAENLGKFLKEF